MWKTGETNNKKTGETINNNINTNTNRAEGENNVHEKVLVQYNVSYVDPGYIENRKEAGGGGEHKVPRA